MQGALFTGHRSEHRDSLEEALRMGLVNRLVPRGQALDAALRLAHELAAFPQRCLRSDRLSAYEQ